MSTKAGEIALSERVTEDYRRCREALERQQERAKNAPADEDFVLPDGVAPQRREQRREQP